MKLKGKKQLENFINNRDNYINYLIPYLKKYGIKGNEYNDFVKQVDKIQEYYENEFFKYPTDIQDKLRLSFWAFFSKLLMDKLGGELKIASPTDYVAGTPQLINYGNRYDKKGKKKWIGIGFDSWLHSHITKNALVSLNGKIEELIEKYS